MMNPPKVVIGYARRKLRRPVTFSGWVKVVTVAFLCLLTIAFGPTIWHRLRFYWIQSNCVNGNVATTVAFTEDFREGQNLLRSENYRTLVYINGEPGRPVAHFPSEFDKLQDIAPIFGNMTFGHPIAFIHGRQASPNDERLIVNYFYVEPKAEGRRLVFLYAILRPSSFFSSAAPTVIKTASQETFETFLFDLNGVKTFRLLCGIPDEKDLAKIHYVYGCDGKIGHIEAVLTGQDTISVSVVDGPLLSKLTDSELRPR